MGFLCSFKLLLAHYTECYKFSMSSMSTIFDVSIKEKRVYGRGGHLCHVTNIFCIKFG